MKSKMSGIYGIITLIVSLYFFLPPVTYGSTGLDVSLGVRLDNARVLSGITEERYLEILITAPEKVRFQRHSSHPPMNIALVIDKSGSMGNADKMDFVKKAATSIVNRLRPYDRISLIAYDSNAHVLIPMQQAGDRGYLARRIDRLHPGGRTNLGAGLIEGYRQVGHWRNPYTINRVILLSDGLANTGITSTYELAGIAAGYYEERISLSTLGVGREFNEDLMSLLAMDGGGMYYYIDSPSRIPEMLAREFSTMETLVASNIILRIDFFHTVTISKIMGNRFERTGKTVVYNVGELSLGERRRYMILLRIPQLPKGKHSIGKVWLQYKSTGSHEDRFFSRTFFLDSVTDRAAVRSSWKNEVIERAYLFELSEARKKAARAVDRGDTNEAQRLLSEASNRLRKADVKSERLSREQKSIQEYAATLQQKPSGEELRRTQKRAKYKSYALEGE